MAIDHLGKPFGKNSPTAPLLKTTSESGDIEAQKKEWIRKLEKYNEFNDSGFVHPFFGKMTRDEIGRFVYKHNDHHLRQFGFNLVIFYMLYAVVWGDIDYRLWLCYLAIIGEGIVLAAFKLHCPLTVWARRYSDSNKHNFDIYIPEWLAKHNKTIYTSIVVAITIYLIFRLTTQ